MTRSIDDDAVDGPFTDKPMYRQSDVASPLAQGDIIDQCPLLIWDGDPPRQTLKPGEFVGRVVALTQACDLAQAKTTRVVVALVHEAQRLVDEGILKPKIINDQLRLHRIYGWYFLPAGPSLPESIVDLRDLHTVPRSMIEDLVQQGRRLCQIESPYREHLAQHFATTYSRIGLPAPYTTSPDG